MTTRMNHRVHRQMGNCKLKNFESVIVIVTKSIISNAIAHFWYNLQHFLMRVHLFFVHCSLLDKVSAVE